MINVHGTCIAFGRFGVLIRGSSGMGKSSLALQLLDSEGFGTGSTKLKARLVADDQVMLERKGLKISASSPVNLAGKIEIRGLGIVSIANLKAAQLRLIVDLVPPQSIPRLPDLSETHAELLALSLPRLYLDAHGTDAAAKLRAAVVHLKSNESF